MIHAEIFLCCTRYSFCIFEGASQHLRREQMKFTTREWWTFVFSFSHERHPHELHKRAREDPLKQTIKIEHFMAINTVIIYDHNLNAPSLQPSTTKSTTVVWSEERLSCTKDFVKIQAGINDTRDRDS